MNLPTLLVFDIDSTLLEPNYFADSKQVTAALYDRNLLSQYIVNTNYQLAIASFNTARGFGIGGYQLGRMILDIYHPRGVSNNRVENAFIQAWMPDRMQDGKNVHLLQIIQAYLQKYGDRPPRVILFDDNQLNVELAIQMGVNSIWTPDGLTSKHMTALGF